MLYLIHTAGAGQARLFHEGQLTGLRVNSVNYLADKKHAGAGVEQCHKFSKQKFTARKNTSQILCQWTRPSKFEVDEIFFGCSRKETGYIARIAHVPNIGTGN